MNNNKEFIRLQAISENSLYSHGVMKYSIEYCYKILLRYIEIEGKAIIELGSAEGLMTELLLKLDIDLTVVEASELFCNKLKIKHTNINIVNSLFEDFSPLQSYDMVIMSHILEHVADPAKILKNSKNWLKKGGRIFSSVPNSNSLHRQAAVKMGLLQKKDFLNELDLYQGHRRVFDPDTFRSLFIDCGLKIHKFGGYWLKPLSNSQIEKNWSSSMINSFMELGEDYPDIAGEIYIVASIN